MNLTDDEILKFQMGSPIFLDDICAIYSVTLREIIEEGYSNFQKYLGVLTATKPSSKGEKDQEVAKILNDLSDFEYLLLMISFDPEVNECVKNALRFFTHESNIAFSLDPAQIILGPLEEKHLLTEDKFYEFQHILRRAYFIEVEGEEIIINKDDPPEVRELKEKMRRNREQLAVAKAKKAARERSDLKLSDLIGSMAINHCNLNIKNIWDITYYAFHDQLKRMGWRDQFNINNQAAMAGAKLKKSQLKHWMRSIANSEKS